MSGRTSRAGPGATTYMGSGTAATTTSAARAGTSASTRRTGSATTRTLSLRRRFAAPEAGTLLPERAAEPGYIDAVKDLIILTTAAGIAGGIVWRLTVGAGASLRPRIH